MDTWDSISDQQFFSLEGFADFFRQLLTFHTTPDLETPAYTVLRCGRAGGGRAAGSSMHGRRALHAASARRPGSRSAALARPLPLPPAAPSPAPPSFPHPPPPTPHPLPLPPPGRRARDYEVRRYRPFLVAQTKLDAAGRLNAAVLAQNPQLEVNPAGQGMQAFNTLAGYIFGNNARGEKMAMTTPVLTTSAGAMQFVIGPGSHKVRGAQALQRMGEAGAAGRAAAAAGAACVCGVGRRGADPASACRLLLPRVQEVSSLPPPNKEGVSCGQQPGGVFAARTFSGLADEEGSKREEQLLRWAVGCRRRRRCCGPGLPAGALRPAAAPRRQPVRA